MSARTIPVEELTKYRAEYVLIEARQGYFEASRHMLVSMQKLMTERYLSTLTHTRNRNY